MTGAARRSRERPSSWTTIGRGLVLLTALGSLSSVRADPDELVSMGEAIYRSAIRLDGTSIAATVQGDVPLPPGRGACSSCHRRSGIGISEGGTARSLNLTAPALFAARDAPPERPAYTNASLTAAIVSGIAVDGRPLDALMPRYQLGEQDARALVAYLRTLGADPSPGINESGLEIATVFSDRTPVSVREAIEKTLIRFVEIKNAGSRRENDRATAARHQAFGRNYQRAHRDWHLSVWRLTGPTSNWRKQLERLHSEAPPFAVVSGSTGHAWSVVHDFCEDKSLPCILPLVSAPPIDNDSFYSVYYSTGVRLEAEVTARHILDEFGAQQNLRIALVHTDDAKGAAARDAFTAYLRDAQFDVLVQAIAPGKQPTTRDWTSLLDHYSPSALVVWTDELSLKGLFGLSEKELLPRSIYTAYSFSRLENQTMLTEIESRLRYVYPFALPGDLGRAFQRERTWLSARGLNDLDVARASQALFAIRIFGEALSDIQTNFSRDYLLETLEHSLDATQMTNIFPNTSIGPGQRFISRGAFVTRPHSISQAKRLSDAVWIQP